MTLKAMTEDDIKIKIQQIETAENSWMYARDLKWYKAWLKYYQN